MQATLTSASLLRNVPSDLPVSRADSGTAHAANDACLLYTSDAADE